MGIFALKYAKMVETTGLEPVIVNAECLYFQGIQRFSPHLLPIFFAVTPSFGFNGRFEFFSLFAFMIFLGKIIGNFFQTSPVKTIRRRESCNRK